MTMKNIETGHLSRFRGELMGAAMLFIMCFHVYLPRTDAFYGLYRMGNIGVDIFFFLSGIGLWYSWTRMREGAATPKAPFARDYASFQRRRLLRIYPVWLLVAGSFYTYDYFTHGGHSNTLADLFGDILINWDFWLHDEPTFWYIPATMMLYLFAPPYMELIRKHPLYRWLPLVAVMWCVVVQWVTPVHTAVGHIEIFWSRIPIFLIGINMAEAVRRKDTLEGSALVLLLLLFLFPLSTSIWLEQVRHGKFPLFVERMLYIPLTVSGLLLLTRVLDGALQWLNRGLRFVGGISLEVYLLHVQFVLVHLEKLGWGYWPKALACIAITLPLAWMLHQAVDKLMKRLHL